jgi:hypothetical protein
VVEIAVTQARWQAVIPFEALDDNRADPPIIYRPEVKANALGGWVGGGLYGIRDLSPTMPCACLDLLVPQQRYLLAIFGEKSSLGRELRPVAQRYGADL